ncbi:hypothetical protein [Streptomyces sp. NPDC005374]
MDSLPFLRERDVAVLGNDRVLGAAPGQQPARQALDHDGRRRR